MGADRKTNSSLVVMEPLGSNQLFTSIKEDFERIAQKARLDGRYNENDGQIADAKQAATKQSTATYDQEQTWSFRRCGVRRNYSECRLDTFQGKDNLVADLRRLEKNRSLILYGNTGCGKTHLAVALMANSRLPERDMYFIDVRYLLDKFRETYRDGASMTATEMLTKYSNIPLLVLDDLGAEKETSYVTEKIGQLIDWRLADDRWTIITTNLTLSALEKKYDARTASRLNTLEYFHINMTDYRKRGQPSNKLSLVK